jgi:organic hydroperoxide reductase OsmC/OhrA
MAVMNMENVYFYETEVEWKGESEGQLRGTNLPVIEVDAPPEFKGQEGRWTPEHLFVASVNTCLMMTFLAIAEYSKLPIVSFRSTATAKLEKVQGAGYQFVEVVIKPSVVIASAQDLGRMPRILAKAKENCFVTKAINIPVKLEPEIFHHQTQTSPCPLGSL